MIVARAPWKEGSEPRVGSKGVVIEIQVASKLGSEVNDGAIPWQIKFVT